MNNRDWILALVIAMAMVSVSEAYTILHREPRTLQLRLGSQSRKEMAHVVSLITRRKMRQTGKFISYSALKKNNVPCGTRGRSYYGCRISGKANPYNRGCTYITNCARDGS